MGQAACGAWVPTSLCWWSDIGGERDTIWFYIGKYRIKYYSTSNREGRDAGRTTICLRWLSTTSEADFFDKK